MKESGRAEYNLGMTEARTQEVKEPALRTAEFHGGSFDILYFAPDSGFNFQPDRSLKRRDELTVSFPAKGINQGNREEVKYQNKQNEAARARGEERNANPLISPDFRVKVNLLNLRRVGDTIFYDTKPSTFVAYNDDENVGLYKPENKQLNQELGTLFAIGMIVITTEADGSSKMIVQHRGTKNSTYKDMIGVSAAGMADQDLDSKNKGTLLPVDTDYVFKMAAKEMEEETGIDPEYLSDIKIVALVEDLRKPHFEAALLGQVNLSAQEVEEMAAEKQSVKRNAFDFAEDFFVLDATPEAIETLLTQVKNPIPPTHMAMFVATGRILVLQRDGEEAAKAWTKKMETEVRRNVEEIDQIVVNATNGAEKGYNHRKTPQEQGLPDIKSELKRTGLA